MKNPTARCWHLGAAVIAIAVVAPASGAQAHPAFGGAPAPLRIEYLVGNYHDSSGGTHTVTCGAEVGADHPNGAEGDYRYLLFVGATDCNEGVVTQAGQAKLWDVANLQRSAVLATAPAYSFYGKEGNSLGYYTRVHDQQSQQIEFNVTLSLPVATGDSQWTNLPEGCSGINTRTATCRWYSPYFQTIPYPPNSDQAEEDNDNVDNVGDPVASPFVDENSPPETAFAATTPPTRTEIDAAEGRVYGLPAGATPADAPTWVQHSEFFQEVTADPRFADGSVTFHGLQAAEFDARAASFRDCLGGEFCMFEHKLGRGRYIAVRLELYDYPSSYGLPSRWEHRVSSARNNNRLGAIRALYHTQHNHCLPYGYVWPRLGHDDDNMFYILPGRRAKLLTRALLLMTLVAAALVGCGDQTDSSPTAGVESTVRAFNAAVLAGDGDAACRLLTPVARERITRKRSCDEHLALQEGAGLEDPKVDDVRLDGERATARLVSGPRSLDVELKRIEGSWNVRSAREVRRGGP